MHRKGLVIGIIFLFVGIYAISPNAQNTQKIESLGLLKGNILYVGGTGPDNYTSIQSAINDASDKDTVFVYDDSSPYIENILINKEISLIGEEKNTTIIDGSRSDSVIYIIKDNVTISGFTIQNGSLDDYGERRAGIEIYSLNNSIIGNIITDNRVGIHPLWAGALNFEGHNIFMNNIFMGNKRDALCIHCSYNIIKHNHFENNSGGVFFQVNSYFDKIEQNNFINCGNPSAGVYRGALNRWKNNYWDDWIGFKNPVFKIFPKAIIKYYTLFDGFRKTLWVSFDWHPASEPYDIK